MIKRIVLDGNEKREEETALSQEIFNQLTHLWQQSGVSNPARGDDFAGVDKTLQNGAHIILLVINEKPAATVWLTHDHRRIYLHHMSVLPELQSRGLGKILMQESLVYAKELKLQIKLEVHRANPAALKLYNSFGFSPLDGYVTMLRREV